MNSGHEKEKGGERKERGLDLIRSLGELLMLR